MNDEINTLENLECYELIDRPVHPKVTLKKLVLLCKRDEIGRWNVIMLDWLFAGMKCTAMTRKYPPRL